MNVGDEPADDLRTRSHGINDLPPPKPLLRKLTCAEADALGLRLERGEDLADGDYYSLVKHANQCDQHGQPPGARKEE